MILEIRSLKKHFGFTRETPGVIDEFLYSHVDISSLISRINAIHNLVSRLKLLDLDTIDLFKESKSDF